MSTAADQAATIPAPPTLAGVIAENFEELEGDLEVLGADTMPGADRAKDIAFADRMLKRLAEAEAHVSQLQAAMKQEVDHITRKYQAAIAGASKRVSWIRFVLENIAKILFPDAKAKTKSLNLPYGTLGRKDFKGAPTLVDEKLALEACRLDHPDRVKATIEAPLSVMRQYLINLVTAARANDGRTAEQLVAGFLVELEAGDPLEGAVGALSLELMWGSLKKHVASGGAVAGVELTQDSTAYTVAVTEG